MVKNVLANAGDIRDSGLIPGSRRSLEWQPHSSIHAWRIPWTEEPGGLHRVHRGAKSRTRLKGFSTHVFVVAA